MTPPAVRLAGPGVWRRRVHAERVWGTVVAFDVRGPGLGPEADAAIADACAFLHRVDGWLSPYRFDSPLALHRNGVLALERTPPVVQEVLAACAAARRRTGGAFDPWAVPGGVDPCGYVKGWAAGEAAAIVAAAGFPNVLVDAAGDIACRGGQGPGEDWAVGILDPADRRAVVEVVRVRDGAVATSGLYERGRHIVDPRTGRRDLPCDSATVVGPDAGLADALATAVLVAGPHTARAWFAGLPAYSFLAVTGRQAHRLGPAFA